MPERFIDRVQDTLPLKSLSGLAALTLGTLSLAGCGSGSKQKTGEWRAEIGCAPHTIAQIEEVVQPQEDVKPIVAFTCDDRRGDPHRPQSMLLDYAAEPTDETQSEAGPGWFAIDYEQEQPGEVPTADFVPLHRSHTPFGFIKLSGVENISVRHAKGPLAN